MYSPSETERFAKRIEGFSLKNQKTIAVETRMTETVDQESS
jgi:hypothetical protein